MREIPSTRTADAAHGAYNARRLLFDVLGIANILAIAASDAAQFPTAGVGFKVYTAVVTLLVTAIWLVLRRYEHPIWLTLLLQLALLGHIAGRTISLDGTELYRIHVLGLRMDKPIHAFNSLAGAAYITVLFRRVGVRLGGWEGFTVIMVACGAGAFVEIVEYLGVLLLPFTYVGDYANNVQDLVANLIGAIAGWALVRAVAGPALRGHDSR